METFSQWLQARMDERGYTQAELARRSKSTTATISRILSGVRNVGPDMCQALAIALNIPADDVYRAAGLLPVKPNASETVSEIIHIANELNNDNRQDLLDYARLRLQKQEREESKHGKRDRVA